MEMSELALRIIGNLPRVDRARLALLLLNNEAEEITFSRHGTRWTAFPWDHVISEQLFIEGSFQEPEIRALLAWLNRHRRFASPRDIVIDLGANIGTSTIPIAQHTGCRVVAVEPVPEIFAVLCRNVADNGLALRVTCIQAAICRAVSNRVLMVLPASNGGGGEVGRPDRKPSFARQLRVRGMVDVPAMALDDLLDSHGIAPDRIAFVWSDTQGCEAEVIESGGPLWAAGVPLFAEFDPTVWGGSNSATALLAAATARFAGFIPAKTLIADAAAKPRLIAELADFMRTIDPEGTDVLLLPKTFEF
jgi:FkbM family methyltransferase